MKTNLMLGQLAQCLPAELRDAVQKQGIKDDVAVKRIPLICPKDITCDEGSRTALQIVSTREPDFDKEVVCQDGLDFSHFVKAGCVFWCHDYNRPPLGRDLEIGLDERSWATIAKTLYSTEARVDGVDIFRLKQEGILRGNSIGFIPGDRAARKGSQFTGKHSFDDVSQKLSKEWQVPPSYWDSVDVITLTGLVLEHSDCGLGCNPESVTLAVSKGYATHAWFKAAGIISQNICDACGNEMPKDMHRHVMPDGEGKKTLCPQCYAGAMVIEKAKMASRRIEEVTMTKTPDPDGIPSASDITSAINRILNPAGYETKPWACLCDLYATQYPSGHMIFYREVQGQPQKYERQDYTYNDDGTVTFVGQSTDVTLLYQVKPETAMAKQMKADRKAEAAEDEDAEADMMCPECGGTMERQEDGTMKCPECEYVEKSVPVPLAMKPYPNEHSARLKDPDDYETCRRTNDKFGEGIHGIFCQRKDDKEKWDLQAVRFDKSEFTATEAREWCEEHNHEVLEFEEAAAEEKVPVVVAIKPEAIPVVKAIEIVQAIGGNLPEVRDLLIEAIETAQGRLERV